MVVGRESAVLGSDGNLSLMIWKTVTFDNPLSIYYLLVFLHIPFVAEK